MDKNANENPDKEPVYPWGGRRRLPTTEEEFKDFYLSAKQELIGRFFIFLGIMSAIFGLLIHLHYGVIAVAVVGFVMGFVTVIKAHRSWHYNLRFPLSLVALVAAGLAFYFASLLPSNLGQAEGFYSDTVVFIAAMSALVCAFASGLLAGQVVRAVAFKK